MWGRETVWFDKNQNLVALVGADAEMDRFEAVREGYEKALPFFVQKGAEDALSTWLTDLSKTIKPVQRENTRLSAQPSSARRILRLFPTRLF
jgi:hypothetical protein